MECLIQTGAESTFKKKKKIGVFHLALVFMFQSSHNVLVTVPDSIS